MIYSVYGFGKMKTEASIGMTVRALQNKDEVLYCQFLKNGSSSEIKFLIPYYNFKYLSTGTTGLDFTEEDIQHCSGLVNYIIQEPPTVNGLVVADEILVAYDLGFISYKQIKDLVAYCKENNMDLCMTGRINSKNKRLNITMLSDVVTNAYAVKHWFNTYCPECKCEYEYHYRYCPKCGSKLQESKPSKKGRDF